MVRGNTRFPTTWSLADLLEHLGHIPPQRIRLHPTPGKATEQDVIDLQAREDRLYELVDGVLVEKPMEVRESCVAAVIIRMLGTFVEERDLGFVTAPDGTLRLAPKLVRIPDVAFISWSRLPLREYPPEPIPDLAPDLAVEVLSEGNTQEEMERKLKDYFFAGTRLVWLVDPEKRVVDVYTAPDQSVRRREEQSLDGGDVLPGFTLPLKQLFARVGRTGHGTRKNGPGRTRKRRNGR
jgi:Uma2 family endonuclease